MDSSRHWVKSSTHAHRSLSKLIESLVKAAYQFRGYTEAESGDAARFCEMTARHGIRTHNALKAIHLDDHFGSRAGGCVPGAGID